MGKKEFPRKDLLKVSCQGSSVDKTFLAMIAMKTFSVIPRHVTFPSP